MPRTQHFLDDQAPKALKWNAGQRWTGHDLMHALMRTLFADGTPASGGYVLSGLTCSGQATAAVTDVTAGCAVHYDETVYTSVLDGTETVCPMGLNLLVDDGTVSHSDNGSGSTRYDLVTIKSILTEDRSLSVQQKGGTLSPQDTRWGEETTLQVVEGTPGGGVPSVPSGETVLWQVKIDPGTVGSGWGAGTTYTDARRFPDAAPGRRELVMTFVNRIATSGVKDMVSFDSVSDSTHKPLAWDIGEAWPIFYRDPSVLAGPEVSGDIYPMGVPGGRTWKRTSPSTIGFETAGSSASVSPETGGFDPVGGDTYKGVRLIHSSGSGVFWWEQNIVVEERGLSLEEVNVSYKIHAGFAGNDDLEVEVFLFKASTGFTDDLTGGAVTLPKTSGNHINEPVPIGSTPKLEEGDVLGIRWAYQADGADTGTAYLYNATAVIEEGKDG